MVKDYTEELPGNEFTTRTSHAPPASSTCGAHGYRLTIGISVNDFTGVPTAKSRFFLLWARAAGHWPICMDRPCVASRKW